MEQGFLARSDVDVLIRQLMEAGYQVWGPTPRAGAVVYDEIVSTDDMPVGMKSVQTPGRYRLEPSGNERLFDYVNGHESLKRFTFAAEETLWTYSADGSFRPTLPEAPRKAIIGPRACDIAGMQVQDRTFIQGRHAAFTDPYYERRRNNLFLVAVNCTRCAETCFCASQGTGPKVKQDFDIALTELDDGLLVEAGSDAGRAIVDKLPLAATDDARRTEADEAIAACAAAQTRRIDNNGIYELLFDNLEHPRWDDVAARCLSCANCVMVCPTCFCHREGEVAAVDGQSSQHVRQWDACFTTEHGSVHGGVLRPEVRQRYRQWLTHKLGSWWKQFDVSGCVGCGRCITWCPTGIDLTEEVAAIRANPGATRT